MRDFAKISCSIWHSRKFRSLPNDDCRLVYLYLHTNPHVNSLGCYVLPFGYAIADLGWNDMDTDPIRYRDCIEALCDSGLIGFDPAESVVRIVDFLKHSPFSNEKHAKGAVKILYHIPDCAEKSILINELRGMKHVHADIIPSIQDRVSDTVSKPYRYTETETETETLAKPREDEPDFQRQNLPTAKSACGEAELGKDRIPAMRDAIVSALGLTGRELNTSGTFVVAGMDPRNLEASLMVWSGHGLTDDQILAAIRAKLATERAKDSQFMPRAIRFFDGPIADFAKRMSSGDAKEAQQKPQAKPLADPKAEAERQQLLADLDRLRGSNSDAAFERRRQIIARLQDLQTAAGA